MNYCINIIFIFVLIISNLLSAKANQIIYNTTINSKNILDTIYYNKPVIELLNHQSNLQINRLSKSIADITVMYKAQKLDLYLDNQIITGLELSTLYLGSQITKIILKTINNKLSLQLISNSKVNNQIFNGNIFLQQKHNKIDGINNNIAIDINATPINFYGNKLTLNGQINFNLSPKNKLIIKSLESKNITAVTNNLASILPSQDNTNKQDEEIGNNQIATKIAINYSFNDILKFNNVLKYNINQNQYYGSSAGLPGIYPEISSTISINNNLEINFINNNNFAWKSSLKNYISTQISDVINGGALDNLMLFQSDFNNNNNNFVKTVGSIIKHSNQYLINDLKQIKMMHLGKKLDSDYAIGKTHINNIINNITPKQWDELPIPPMFRAVMQLQIGNIINKIHDDLTNNNQVPKSQTQINSFTEIDARFNYSNDIKIYNNNLQFGYNLTMHNNDSMVHKRSVIYRESNNVQSALTDRDKFIKHYNKGSIKLKSNDIDGITGHMINLNKLLQLSNANIMYASGVYSGLAGGSLEANNASLARISNYACNSNGAILNNYCFSTASPIDYREQHKIYWNHQYQFNPNINAEYGISYQYAYRTNIINPFNQINGLDQKQYSNNNKTSYTPIIMSKLLKQNASNNLYYNQYNNKKEKIFDLINNNNHVDHLIDGYIQGNINNQYYNIAIDFQQYNHLPTDRQLWLNSLSNNTKTLLPENITALNFDSQLYGPNIDNLYCNMIIGFATKWTRNAIAPVISKKAKPFLPLINKLNYLYAKMPYNKTKYTITDSIIKLEQEILQKFLDADDPLILVNGIHLANRTKVQKVNYYNIGLNIGYKNIINANYNVFGSNQAHTSTINQNIIFNLQLIPGLHVIHSIIRHNQFTSFDEVSHNATYIGDIIVKYNIDLFSNVDLQLFFKYNNIFAQDQFNQYGSFINNKTYIAGGINLSF